MSSDKILLEDDDNAMFGDGEEEEEEEDVDMALPPTTTNSPFPHHNVGPIADRLRNAMNRITADPTRDAEAWQALLTEAQSSYRTLLPSLYKLKNSQMGAAAVVDPEAELIGTKLDWVEGCYGALLHNFPYAVTHYVQLVDMFLRLGALTQDEEEQCGTASPAMIAMGTSALSNLALTTTDQGVAVTPASMLLNADLATSATERQKMYDAKLDRIFQMCLGVNMDGSPALHGEVQTSQTIDAESVATSIDSARTVMGGLCKHSIELWLLFIRKRTWDASRAAAVEIAIPPPPPGYTPGVAQAYETALEFGAGFAQNNHLIWKRYVNFVKSWTEPHISETIGTTSYHLSTWSDSSDDRSGSILAGIRSIRTFSLDSLGTILVAEWLPKYQHARSIYLERNRVWTVHELKGGRLAVPPVGCNVEGAVVGVSTRAAGVVGAGDDFGGEATGGAGAAGTGKPLSDSEYMAQMEDERVVLSKWRRRAAYERTNPERLSATDHASRVRASYSEEVCAFARHPEVWYEWSQWELLHDAQPSNQGTASAALITPAKAGDAKSGGNAIRAVAVLGLGMESLPDSALLAQAQAEILERHLGGESKVACIKVLEQFVKRSPTTLGFVLLQRLVRRHQGVDAARSVFSNARRTLQVREEDLSSENEDGTGVSAATKQKDGINKDETNDDGDGQGAILPQNRMVMNRLGTSTEGEDENAQQASAGFITWHLYAAHATIEHHLSKKPKVAARIYELGLRKHRTFLSTPPYVLHYANLLLELNDEENLRSLLMRAVAACEEEEASSGGSDEAAIARRREMQRPLWDMMLKFESILSSRGSNGNISADISSIESRRRRALYGPGNEDVVMGGEIAPDEEEDRNLGSGAQKNSLNEQLIRVEGYDVASRIANGMARMVDVLTITGAIGMVILILPLDFAAAAAASLAAGGTSSDVWGDECAGGASDVSYVKRLRFQRESPTRAATALFGGLPGAGQAVVAQVESYCHPEIVLLPWAKNAPEWLRPLIALLPPVPKFGRGITKPPPHLIEMALSTLRANVLPSRPTNGAANDSKKRRRDDGDSSDEEGNGASGGGYSSQFRSRQRSRLTEHTS
ncbi:RNA cleavage stimulation factor [Skeletonema marinoi]|uniref:RNA cleavage stimulation factor n=1 Tax=Skeletonema marinoi TaxID=267567 RepID=A0AAD9DGJ3_9STRA|nr:RNA cleavage stimulation factor [Skeletonema marinoi]